MKRSWLLLRLLYWRRYALKLEAQLEGERWRNQAREDQLLTIGMRFVGFLGVATREGPAQQIKPLRRSAERNARPAHADAWSNLTDEERAEWPMYLADADPDGSNVAAVKREFLQMIEYRRQGNEEIM